MSSAGIRRKMTTRSYFRSRVILKPELAAFLAILLLHLCCSSINIVAADATPVLANDENRSFIDTATATTASAIGLLGNDAKQIGKNETLARDLSTFDKWDFLAILFLSLGLALAAAGGVGGGPVIVPVLVLMLHFDIKLATPLSAVTIIGGAVANAIFNVPKRHPKVNRPLIDPDICLAMIPPIIGGAIFGTFLSKLLPSYVIALLFVVVLGAGGARTLKKGLQLHQKEVKEHHTKTSKSLEAVRLLPAEEGSMILKSQLSNATNGNTTKSEAHGVTSTTIYGSGESAPETKFSFQCLPAKQEHIFPGKVPINNALELAEILAQESTFSWRKHALIFFCYAGIAVASIAGAVVTCGSLAYWVLLIAEIPWLLLFSVVSSFYLTHRYSLKRSLNYKFADGDVEWTPRAVVWFPTVCALAGVLAGFFGIGGGIITGPLMIEMGVVPQVASATSALMVLYAAAAATAKFAVFNMIAWDWGLLLCAVAFVVTTASQLYIVGYVRKSGKQSIIVLCIGSTIALGAVLMAYQALKSTFEEARKPFTVSVCTNSL